MSDHPVAELHTRVARAAALPGLSAGSLGAWLERLLLSAENGVLIVDDRLRIVMANSEAGRIFGYTDDVLLDHPLEMLLPERMRVAHVRQLSRFATTRIAGRRLRVKLDMQALRADGQEFYVGTSLSRLTMNGQLFMSVVLQELAPHHHPRAAADVAPGTAGSSQQADEIEKRYFSRALYDDVGQGLSVLKLDLDWCERQSAHAQIAERLARMQQLLDDVIINTKNIASSLRPPLLDDFGLVAATEWLAGRFRKRTGLACSLECRQDLPNAGSVVESAVFRIIQEALLNIEQHARARHVDISLWRSKNMLHVAIEDDGIGMTQISADKAGCLGLKAMQERVALLGGSMQLKNLVPSGVALLASLPAAPPITTVAHS